MCALKAALVSQFSIHLEYENLGREETELSLAVNSNDHIEVTGETLSLSKFAHSAGGKIDLGKAKDFRFSHSRF